MLKIGRRISQCSNLLSIWLVWIIGSREPVVTKLSLPCDAQMTLQEQPFRLFEGRGTVSRRDGLVNKTFDITLL